MAEEASILPQSLPETADAALRRPRISPWRLVFPVLVGTLAAGSVVALHGLLRLQEGVALLGHAERNATQLAMLAERSLDLQVDPLRRMYGNWLRGELRWNNLAPAAEQIMAENVACRAIVWARESGVVQAVAPTRGNAALIGRDLRQDLCWGPALRQALQSGRESIDLASEAWPTDGPSLVVAMPLVTPSERAARNDGVILARLALPAALGLFRSQVSPDFDYQLVDQQGREILASPNRPSTEAATSAVAALNQRWKLRLWMGSDFLAQQPGWHMPSQWVLGLGLTASVLAGLGVLQTVLHRHRRLLQSARHVAALETLQRVYQAATLDESLELLVQTAPQVLGVELCAVALCSGQSPDMTIAAATRPLAAPIIGKRFAVHDTGAAPAVAGPHAVASEDGARGGPVHPALEPLVRGGSLLYVPMFKQEGTLLGMLIFARSRPGVFDGEQVSLARVFAIRAAAAIETARLHAQVLSDARTRATLLRELQHRVKNTLAGIVALLSVGNNEFPQDVQRWLDRVTDRIRTIAAAHELLAGPMGLVSLRDLVGQVLPSLSALQTGDIVIHSEISGSDVSLSGQQAISLAMVLHELAYNAVAHGLAGGGKLIVRVSRPDNNRVTIEVIDDGVGCRLAGDAGRAPRTEAGTPGSAPPRAIPRSGHGLALVRELVGRELRGTFGLRRAPSGGTVATVEFEPDISPGG